MDDFKLNEHASIDNINARKEGSREDQVLALDVKLTATVPYPLVALLLGADANQLKTAFWADSELQEPRFLNIGSIQTPNDTQFDHLSAVAARMQFNNCTAKKFSFVPIAGCQADLTFTLAIPSLDEDGIGVLAEYLKEELNIKIYPEQESLALSEAG